MEDPEVPNTESAPLNDPSKGLDLGCRPNYLLSIPGTIRILNIILGIASVALWVPGYEHEFVGENLYNVGIGYGNGWKRETLNQFVLAAIIICLACSICLLLGLVLISQAYVDWNRFNKLAHLGLGLFLLIAGICSVFGTWYFQENCCHIEMFWKGFGVGFNPIGEGYVKHCYCYLTKYFSKSEIDQITDVIIYDATKNQDMTGFTDQWTFAAHHIYSHVAAIFVIFINAIAYLVAFAFSKNKSLS